MASSPQNPLPHDVLRRASDGTDTDELQRFLQLRVTLFVRTMAVLFSVLYVGGAVLIGLFAASYFVTVHVHPAKIVNGGLAILLLAAWQLVRRRQLGVATLHAVDFASSWVIALGAGIGVATAPSGYFFELGGLLILVVVLILRAAIVPSTPQFTTWVGLACAPCIMGGAYLQASTHETIGFVTPALVAIGTGGWAVATTFVSAMVSREIYGLVTQVRRAMQLGRYTLREKIGEGGMGAVYRAEHAMLRRKTAIKLLLPDRVSASALMRFEREVQLTSQLSHPNTIAIHDYGRTPQGVFYYAMEFLNGKSLEQLIEDEGPQPPGRVVHILKQVAGSLREAHAAGLIHRDIKPGNLFVGVRGGMRDFVKVIDFGLVKQLDAGDAPTLSRADAIAGTPLFMAPESVTDPESIDAKVDTYALGATAYYLLTGTPVFEGRSMVEVCGHHLHSVPEPPSRRIGQPVPARLEALILRCLAKQPEQRPDDDELLSELSACERESPWEALAPQEESTRVTLTGTGGS
jgi:eukaryotic-like serine/threonine-protein kinase